MKTSKHIPLVASIAFLGGGLVAALAAPPANAPAKQPLVELSVLTSVRTSPRTKPDGSLNNGSSFIVAHDYATQRIFITNATANTIDVLDVSDLSALELGDSPVLQLSPNSPGHPSVYTRLDMGAYGSQPLSVSTYNGIVAVSMQAGTTGSVKKTDPGTVVFFDSNLNFLKAVKVGAYPDMLTFTPNGRYVLVANEGEPNLYATGYPEFDSAKPSIDPEGSISIIDVSGGAENLTQAQVSTADFHAFNGFSREELFKNNNIRVFGPNATVAQDLEPEYIAVSKDSKTAWVTLQEANALAIVDIPSATVKSIVGMGVKDHSLSDNGFGSSNALDASDRDNKINIQNWPVKGLYQSDAIASYKVDGKEYLVLANEGDSRDYSQRIKDPQDPTKEITVGF